MYGTEKKNSEIERLDIDKTFFIVIGAPLEIVIYTCRIPYFL